MLCRSSTLFLAAWFSFTASVNAQSAYSRAEAYNGGESYSTAISHDGANVRSVASTIGGRSSAHACGVGTVDVEAVAVSQYGVADAGARAMAAPGSYAVNRVYAMGIFGVAQAEGEARAVNGGVAQNTLTAIAHQGGRTRVVGEACADGPAPARNYVHGESYCGGYTDLVGSADAFARRGGYAQADNRVIGVSFGEPVQATGRSSAAAVGGRAHSRTFLSTVK